MTEPPRHVIDVSERFADEALAWRVEQHRRLTNFSRDEQILIGVAITTLQEHVPDGLLHGPLARVLLRDLRTDSFRHAPRAHHLNHVSDVDGLTGLRYPPSTFHPNVQRDMVALAVSIRTARRILSDALDIPMHLVDYLTDAGQEHKLPVGASMRAVMEVVAVYNQARWQATGCLGRTGSPLIESLVNVARFTPSELLPAVIQHPHLVARRAGYNTRLRATDPERGREVHCDGAVITPDTIWDIVIGAKSRPNDEELASRDFPEKVGRPRKTKGDTPPKDGPPAEGDDLLEEDVPAEEEAVA